MKKFVLITAIFQIIFGILGIAATIILIISGENMIKWIGAILVSILLIIGGILNLVSCTK